MKSFKKYLLALICSLMVIFAFSTVSLADISEENVEIKYEKAVTEYTYTITPILEPFNEYFFVQTDNPDPKSFRFVDKSSVYGEDSLISLELDYYSDEAKVYEDIRYENQKTGRVNGGYIFKSNSTDGGEIVLQSNDNSYYDIWSDTGVRFSLPELMDETDYLINTYATETDFFDNMDVVQSGFSSICLYSGSYVRGEIYKGGLFWSLSTSPHKDQYFYLQSPYGRKDNKNLFATAIYPYRYDSLGFPSMMAEVSKRLDNTSSYEWNEYSHAYIDVTYNGETRSYGGQGSGKGQGIDTDDINQYFEFGNNGTGITLESAYQLLKYYSGISMEDDVPREDALTWEEVCDSVGEGSWVRLICINSIFGGESTGYTYLYKKGDGKNHYADAAGNNGAEIYWGGDMGFLSDAWVDGRYISAWEKYVPGAKFDEHPTSKIMITNVLMPQITYDYRYIYNSSTSQYEKVYYNVEITEKRKNVLFNYEGDVWTAGYGAFDSGCANYNDIVALVEESLIDKKYLEMVTLTLDEVKALKVDKNTNTAPEKGLIYDGTVNPGTPFELSIALTADKRTVNVGDEVTFTANAKGFTGDLTYSYLIWNKDTDQWYRVPFSSKSEYKWKAGSEGNRVFYVEVKDEDGKIKRSSGVNVTASIMKEIVLTADKKTTVVGDTVTFIAKATGYTGNITYSYLIWNKDTNTWYRVPFSVNSTYKWKADTSGNRIFYVDVKDGSGKVARSAGVTVATSVKTLDINVTVDKNYINVGEKVTFTVSGKGGNLPYQYSYVIFNKNTNTWYRVPYSTDLKYVWTALSEGTRIFYVEVKDGSGNVLRHSGIVIVTV